MRQSGAGVKAGDGFSNLPRGAVGRIVRLVIKLLSFSLTISPSCRLDADRKQRSDPMRSLLVSCVVAFALFGGFAPAQAEKRIFIIANNPDGYGVDRCLANGQRCGQAMASHFCRIRDFKRAISFHRVGRGEITGGVPLDSYACAGRKCDEFVAIECVR
jgi:hypothetical protein